MLWRVLLLAVLGSALVAKHDPRGGHLEDYDDDEEDDDSVVIEGELRQLARLHNKKLYFNTMTKDWM
jgi:hypothetical protein